MQGTSEEVGLSTYIFLCILAEQKERTLRRVLKWLKSMFKMLKSIVINFWQKDVKTWKLCKLNKLGT